MSIIRLILVGLLIVHFIQVQSQEDDVISIMNHQIPPAPNTAALGRYGEIPVSYYTGQANVSIPIYEIKSGELSLPISLSYQAIFKVQDIPSWVGSGWSLNAGGVIGLSVRGKPDFDGGGFCNEPAVHPAGYFSTYQMGLAVANVIETQPDSYNLSAPFGSFKFVPSDTCTIDNCEFLALPYNQVSMKFKKPINTDGYWEVMDANGNFYLFGETEDGYGKVEKSRIAPSDAITINEYVSGWYLAKMFNPNRTDSISFEYELDLIQYEALTGIMDTQFMPNVHYSCVQNITVGTSYNYTQFDRDQARISKIKFAQGELNFIEGSERLDLPGSYPLSRIELSNNSNQIVKSWELTQTYFSSSTQSDRKRLKLDRIQEVAQNENLPGHTFSYNDNFDVPSYLGLEYMDRWGYMNGNTGSPIPKFNEIRATPYIYPNGGDRNPDSTYTSAFLLKKITYPTGGYSEFEYEPHRASMRTNRFIEFYNEVSQEYSVKAGYQDAQGVISNFEEVYFSVSFPGAYVHQEWNFALDTQYEGDAFANAVIEGDSATSEVGVSPELPYNSRDIFLPAGDYHMFAESDSPSRARMTLTVKNPQLTNNKLIGGARIKSIKNYGADGEMEQKTFNYKYRGAASKSSGLVVNFPNYMSGLIQEVQYSLDGELIPNNCNLIQFSSSNMVAASSASHVGYEEVWVSNGNGFESFQYTCTEYPDSEYTNDFPYPPSPNNDYKRGLLKTYAVYNSDSLMLKRTDNEYVFDITNNFLTQGISFILHYQRLVGASNDYYEVLYDTWSNWVYTPKTTVTEYFNNGLDSIVSVQKFKYNPETINLEVQENEFGNSKSKIKYEYVESGTSAGNEMIARNMVAVPVLGEKWNILDNDSTIAAATKIDYQLIGDLVLPEKAYKYNVETEQYELAKTFVKFDSKGHILEELSRNGVSAIYIWGYNNTQMIARLENVSYDALTSGQQSAISDIITASNADDDNCRLTNCTEQELRNSFNSLLTAFNGIAASFVTHDPLIGVTSTMDSNGNSQYYQYDSFGRLQFVRDQNGKILSKSEYNYQGN